MNRRFWNLFHRNETNLIRAVAPSLKADVTPILRQMDRTHRAQLATQYVKQMGGMSDNSNIGKVYHY